MASKLDAYVDTVKAWLATYKTNEEIVRLFESAFTLKTTEASVRRLIERFDDLKELSEIRHEHNRIQQEADAVAYSANGDDEVIVTEPIRKLGEHEYLENVARLTIEEVMARHQLDPEVWECDRANPNVWQGQRKGGEIINFYQFKLYFKKRVPIKAVVPAYEPLARTFKAKKIEKPEGTVLTMIETDPQCPFLIPELNELALQFISTVKPDRHILGGDLMNLGYVGRHRDNPAWDDTVNEAKQSAFEYLYYRRCANEDMEMHVIPGNHDDRIRNEQLERNERLYGITQAHYPGEEDGIPVYSLAHLMRFDELDINYNEPKGTYEFEFVEITPLLAVRHGHKLNASKTAPINTAMDLGHSVVLGHSHSQSAVAKTVWNKITNEWHVRWGIEAGCECEIEEGLGFNKAGAPDWQPGFVTVTSWPNGRFTFDFASYTPEGALLWRDQKFTL